MPDGRRGGVRPGCGSRVDLGRVFRVDDAASITADTHCMHHTVVPRFLSDMRGATGRHAPGHDRRRLSAISSTIERDRGPSLARVGSIPCLRVVARLSGNRAGRAVPKSRGTTTWQTAGCGARAAPCRPRRAKESLHDFLAARPVAPCRLRRAKESWDDYLANGPVAGPGLRCRPRRASESWHDYPANGPGCGAGWA